MSEFNNLISMLNDKNDIILSQQAKIDELEFKLSSTVNNFDNSCKTIAIYQKFLDDADVANKFLTDKIDELQARIDGALEKCYIGIRKQGGDHYLELIIILS